MEPFVLLTAAAAIAAASKKRSEESTSTPIIDEVRRRISYLHPKFGSVPIKESDSSYTEDKSIIYLCLRSPRTGERYGINTIMYVVLHELAHGISLKHDPKHGPEFQRNFDSLLSHAARLGIWNPHLGIPKDYCGMK
jgi:predicted metal-dependent hydrolase